MSDRNGHRKTPTAKRRPKPLMTRAAPLSYPRGLRLDRLRLNGAPVMEPDLDRKPLAAAELLLAPEYAMLRDGPVRDFGVMVSGGKFGDVGPLADLTRRHPHLQAVKMSGKLVMPGFIDAHH